MSATKDEIADAFERHVERYGFGRASVEGVAKDLGISKRTIYQHFSSKKDLFAYVVERVAIKEEKRLRRAIADPGGSPTASMRRFLALVIDGTRSHVLATSEADWMQEFEIALEAMTEAYGAVGLGIVRDGVAAGEFSVADPALANRLIAAMLTEYGLALRQDPGLDRDEVVIGAAMRMLGACGGPADEE